MGYDINTGIPLFARMFRGSCNDKLLIIALDLVRMDKAVGVEDACICKNLGSAVGCIPLFARMFRGSCNDKSTIADIADLLQFSGILFVRSLKSPLFFRYW